MHYNAEDTATLYYIEAHRKTERANGKLKATEVLEMSYRGRLIYKSLFLYQRYTKGIQKASIY